MRQPRPGLRRPIRPAGPSASAESQSGTSRVASAGGLPTSPDWLGTSEVVAMARDGGDGSRCRSRAQSPDRPSSGRDVELLRLFFLTRRAARSKTEKEQQINPRTFDAAEGRSEAEGLRIGVGRAQPEDA